MADIFDTAQDDKGLALAGLLLGMGQGFSRAGQRGGSFMSGLGDAGGSGFNTMLGFQRFANQDTMRKFQIAQMKREMEREEAIRRGMTEGGAPALAEGGAPTQQATTHAPSSSEGLFGAAAPVAPVERAELPADLFGVAQADAAMSPSVRYAAPGEVPVLLRPGDRRPSVSVIGNGPSELPSVPLRLPPARGVAPPPVMQGTSDPPVPLPQGPLPGQQSPTAPQPPQPPSAPPQQARASVPPLLRGLPPEIASQVQRIAQVDPKGGYKMLLDFTGEMLKAGRWEMVPHPSDPNSFISVDKYGMRPPVAVPFAFAQEAVLKQLGATRVDVNQRVDQAGGVELAKLGAKALTDTYERMPQVQNQLGSLDLMEQALEGYRTGFAGDTGLKIRQGLEAIGIKTNAPAGEFFDALATASQLGTIPPGQGAVSNFERELFAKAAPSLSKTPEGNKLLIEAKRAILQRELQGAKMLQEEVEASRDNLGLAFTKYGRRMQGLGPTLSPSLVSRLRGAAAATGEAPTTPGGGGIEWKRGPDGKPVRVQ